MKAICHFATEDQLRAQIPFTKLVHFFTDFLPSLLSLVFFLQVIFTEKVKPFKEINHNDFHFDDSAKISFENADIMKAYYDLQTIKCPKCRSSNQTAFMDFKALQAHVKEEHNHTYCDLCVKHLKVFIATVIYPLCSLIWSLNDYLVFKGSQNFP